MAQFMLLLRGGEAEWAAFSPEQMQEVVQLYFAWGDKLKSEKRLHSGEELKDGGSTLRVKGGEVVVDGPYAETKESVGGYYLIDAGDLAEASEVAKGCPILRYNGVVEVREINRYS